MLPDSSVSPVTSDFNFCGDEDLSGSLFLSSASWTSVRRITMATLKLRVIPELTESGRIYLWCDSLLFIRHSKYFGLRQIFRIYKRLCVALRLNHNTETKPIDFVVQTQH